ncbi:MAG: hypothetical protein NC336_10285 [Clostridium sp.]|nr:hypothetical protein [Clostridium sp.]
MKQLTKYLLAGAAAVAATASLSAQSFTVNLKSGESVTYNNADVASIDFSEESAEPVVVAPKIGDFYYSDGTWSTNLDESKTPIAIVFSVGEAADYRDRAAFYTLKDGQTPMEQIHGYAVAITDATAGVDDWDLPYFSPWNGSDPGSGCSTDVADFLGYTNTASIIARNTREGGDLKTAFPATWYATEHFEEVCPAPASSSGWYLPAVGMFKYIYDRVYFSVDDSDRACVERSFDLLGEETATPLLNPDASYWSSTEKVDSYGYSSWGYYFNFDSRSIKPGFVGDYRKNVGFRVRSILTF